MRQSGSGELRWCSLFKAAGICLFDIRSCGLPKSLLCQGHQRGPNQGSSHCLSARAAHKRGRGEASQTHQYLSENTSFSNPQARLWFQTLINRKIHHHSRLSTLKKNSETGLQLERTFSVDEIIRLVPQGLRYIVIDSSQLAPGAAKTHTTQLSQIGFGCQKYDEWGGVYVCRWANRASEN